MIKKNNKNGFTLVEVLAAIAILAILVVFAVPSVIKSYKRAKMESFRTKAQVVYKAWKNDYSNKIIHLDDSVNNKEYSSFGSNKLDITNANFKYCVKVEDGKMTMLKIGDGEYYLEINGDVKESDINSSTILEEDNDFELCDGIDEVIVNLDVNLGSAWTNETCGSEYTLNGVACSKSVAYGSVYGTLLEPTRSDYDFQGWFTSGTGGTLVTSDSIFNGTTAQSLYAQWKKKEPTIVYATKVGGASSDYLLGIESTTDGGMIAAGYFSGTLTIPASDTSSGSAITLSASAQDPIFIKYNSVGKVEWAKSIGGDAYTGMSAVQTTDGNYMGFFSIDSYSATITVPASQTVSGSAISISYNGNMGEITIIKYNSVGKVISMSNISTHVYLSTANSHEVTSDGGFILGGGTSGANSIPASYTSSGTVINFVAGAMLTKYNSSGKIMWSPSIANIGYWYTAKPTSDGGALVTGASLNAGTLTIPATSTASGTPITISNNVTSEMLTVKYNNVGKVEWARKYPLNSTQYIRQAFPTSDGGYVLVGNISGTTTIPASYTVSGSAITLTTSGGTDSLMIKFNSAGKVEWAKVNGGSGNERYLSGTQITDGGFVGAGIYSSSPLNLTETTSGSTIPLILSGGSDTYIVKYK